MDDFVKKLVQIIDEKQNYTLVAFSMRSLIIIIIIKQSIFKHEFIYACTFCSAWHDANILNFQ